MVNELPSETIELSRVMDDLSENTKLLVVIVDPGVLSAPLLPYTSTKEEVKLAGVLLVLNVTLLTWIESLVKLAALKVTDAATYIRV